MQYKTINNPVKPVSVWHDHTGDLPLDCPVACGYIFAMSESLFQFLKEHPFWAIFIIVFMVLPMIGAVLHIVLKALGRKGIDNSPPAAIPSAPSGSDGEPDKMEFDKSPD